MMVAWSWQILKGMDNMSEMIKSKKIYRVKRIIEVETWADIECSSREHAVFIHDDDCKFSPECVLLNDSEHDVSVNWRTIETNVELHKVIWDENEE